MLFQLIKSVVILLVLNASFFVSTLQAFEQKQAVKSEIIKTSAGELILYQSVKINAPVSKVWAAYTTSVGYSSWAASKANIDLRVGGTIKSIYSDDKSIGEEGTITLNIINYVPEKVLTLRAELSSKWPKFMQEDADNLMNIIVFESIGEKQTLINSYGSGYRDIPEYLEIIKFFIPANEFLLNKLKTQLEK